MSSPYDWRIDEIERKASRAESRLYELDSFRSELDRLAYTVRELSSEVTGLRDELQACKDQQAQHLIEQGDHK